VIATSRLLGPTQSNDDPFGWFADHDGPDWQRAQSTGR
jgi:hypothetical protein